MPPEKITLKNQKTAFDLPLIVVTFLLIVFGLIAIYDATVVAAYRDFGDQLYYFKNQLIWASLATLAMVFLAYFDYRRLLRISPFILILAISLLILVLIPHIGTKVYGARRWISLGDFTFQPSEFAKIALILYATNIMVKFHHFKIKILDVFQVLFLPAAAATILVLFQPDLGTAFIFVAIVLAIYFVAGGPLWHFLLAIPMVVGSILLVIITEPYRFERLKSFLDPSYDPQGASYQINQIIIAISSGKLFGVGLGGSRSKFAFIPEVQSDAIFAVLTEELGFIGAIFMISLFLILIRRTISIAQNCHEYQGRLLGLAIAAFIAIQTLFNLASNVALVPLSGIPLPFISYGGSSLFATMSAIGILLAIRRQS